MGIRRLSNAEQYNIDNSSGLVMVGSFAPVHEGHLDAMRSAERALLMRGEQVFASTFAPNSDSYVSVKLNDSNGRWSFSNRVGEFLSKDAGTIGIAYIDDITGRRPPEKSISECVIDTVSHRLGIKACRLVLVVGTDQIGSMRPHLEQNRAICVLRPGWESVVDKYAKESWFRDAVADERYMFTKR